MTEQEARARRIQRYNRRQSIRMRKRKRNQRALAALLGAVVLVAAIVFGVKMLGSKSGNEKVQVLTDTKIPEWIDVQILPEDCESRRGVLLEDINSIVVHYVANPGTTAQNNRDYYDNDGVEVNSHFVVGLDGEIIQCLPLNEKSSASNDRNRDTISIEVCHPDDTGEFTEITYDALVKLSAWLCDVCDFKEGDIIRHYDVIGKMCPLYYVENEDAWLQLKSDIMDEAKKL